MTLVLARGRGRHAFAAAGFALAAALGLAACERVADIVAPDVPAPRSFMRGGAWFPAATGYWFHQYAEIEELTALMSALDFACATVTPADGNAGAERLHCERSFRAPGGILSRTDTAEFGFRRNGAVEFAESGCRCAFFDSPKLSGACQPFAAPGAVYPSVATYARVVDAMLRPAANHQPVSVRRLKAAPRPPLRDADEAVELLARWRFDCDVPKQHYRVGFRGKTGEVTELRCRQHSLRAPGRPQQSQHVVVRYDTVDLAVLGVEVRLDDATATLTQAINSRKDRDGRAGGSGAAAPPPLMLETRSGEKFEVPIGAVGTGSRQATRDGFESLTPASQRELLKAYLDKLAVQWGAAPGRLSWLTASALEWYGPEALPHLAELLSDERPVLGAALLKYLCFESTARSEARLDYALRSERLWETMRTCIDRRRADLPRSLAMMDQLLARDLRSLEASDARTLNAFFDFRRDVFYVAALGVDAKEAGRTLEAVVAGKDGLSPDLRELVAGALAGTKRRDVAVPDAPSRTPELQLSPDRPAPPSGQSQARRDQSAR
jgi:hypothetical protein